MKVQLLNRAYYRPIPKVRFWERQKFELGEPLEFFTDKYGLIVCEKGTVWNLSSIPRIPGLHYILPVNDDHIYSSCLHDELYSKKKHGGRGYMKTSSGVVKITRKAADKLFYWCSLAEGLEKWKAKLMYRGLRMAFFQDLKSW